MSDGISAALGGDSMSFGGRLVEACAPELVLARREAQVAELLALGHSEKQIAYALGLSPSGVSRCIQSAARKLGLGSRAELAAVFAPLSRGESGQRLPPLSPAEREVASLATRGHSDTEIAAARGASPRTVGNQLSAIYRKLGVHSRTELAALLGA